MPQLTHDFDFAPGDIVLHRQSAYNEVSFNRSPRFLIVENHAVVSASGQIEAYYLIRPEGPDTGSFHRISEMEACSEKEYKLIVELQKRNGDDNG